MYVAEASCGVISDDRRASFSNGHHASAQPGGAPFRDGTRTRTNLPCGQKRAAVYTWYCTRRENVISTRDCTDTSFVIVSSTRTGIGRSRRIVLSVPIPLLTQACMQVPRHIPFQGSDSLRSYYFLFGRGYATIPYAMLCVSVSINQSLHTSVPGMTGHLNLPSSDLCTVWYRTRWYLCDL